MPRPSSVVARTVPVATGQLALGLPAPLPALELEPDWREAPRLWGHAFHPMCSYLASHPASLSHAFIARWSRPGDVVLDPFSGRGTTPLQACAEGRVGVGNDLNPFAHLLTAAKIEPASLGETLTRLTAVRLAWAADGAGWRRLANEVIADATEREPGADAGSTAGHRGTPAGSTDAPLVPSAGSGEGPADGIEPVPAEVAIAFHPATFGQLLAVRSALRPEDRTDRFMLAALAGVLHGRTAGYLSTLMPNTFSMAPRYVRGFARRTGYEAPERDVFTALEVKLRRLFRDPLPAGPGVALLGDAREVGERARAALLARGLPDRARLVVSSPPYLRVVKYGYYNWLRAWCLGLDVRAIDADLDDGHGVVPYLRFMAEVLADLRVVLADDAVVALIIGDVEMDRGRASRDGHDLAAQVWEAAARPAGYELAGVVADPVAASRKMTRLWGPEAGRATKTDRILVLAASTAGRRRAVAGAEMPVDWTWPPRRLHLA
jgi:hypothetical protein